MDRLKVRELIKEFLRHLSGTACDRITYHDLQSGLIGTDGTDTCVKAGKSAQRVYICDPKDGQAGYVYKAQSTEDHRVISVEQEGNGFIAKVDPFTMNLIMQQMMLEIVQLDPSYDNNIEHPISVVCSDNGHLVLIYNRSNSGDFQNYLLNNPYDPQYLNNITGILNKVIEVNDMLYKKCQFQHCDMKCMQILLKTDTDGKLIPILSDFDKSTATFLVNDKPAGGLERTAEEPCVVRFILKKDDRSSKDSGDLFNIASGGSRKVKRNNNKPPKRKRKIKNYTKKTKITKKKKIKKKKITKKKRGGSSALKSLGKKAFAASPTKIKQALGGKQYLERYEKIPLNNNNFYNACLLASTLLLCHDVDELWNHLETNLTNKTLLSSLDKHLIEELNPKIQVGDKTLRTDVAILRTLGQTKENIKSGNQVAADMVSDTLLSVRAEELKSEVILL